MNFPAVAVMAIILCYCTDAEGRSVEPSFEKRQALRTMAVMIPGDTIVPAAKQPATTVITTAPVTTTTTVEVVSTPAAAVVKQVPKARKVSAPKQVKVQPVKVVKPKIIKPAVKIL